MMKFLLLVMIVATAAAMNIVLDNNPEITVRVYDFPQEVITSFNHNQFLSLPLQPSDVFQGTDLIHMKVPPPLESYVWELTGYFKAESTGEYNFSIGDTKSATIQLGSKSESHDFYERVVDEMHEITKSPVSFFLQKGVHYPVKVSYIAGIKRVPVYVTFDGTKRELNDEIRHVLHYSSLGSQKTDISAYYTTGFDFFAFLIPHNENSDKKYAQVLKNYHKYTIVAEGCFNDDYVGLHLTSEVFPHTLEITGHIQPPATGEYTFTIEKDLVAGFQIGPGIEEKEIFYFMGDDWNILDTRTSRYENFFFERGWVYPFRIVIFGYGEDLQSGLKVCDSDDVEIDLFKLSLKMAQPPPEDPLTTLSSLESPPDPAVLAEPEVHESKESLDSDTSSGSTSYRDFAPNLLARVKSKNLGSTDYPLSGGSSMDGDIDSDFSLKESGNKCRVCISSQEYDADNSSQNTDTYNVAEPESTTSQAGEVAEPYQDDVSKSISHGDTIYVPCCEVNEGAGKSGRTDETSLSEGMNDNVPGLTQDDSIENPSYDRTSTHPEYSIMDEETGELAGSERDGSSRIQKDTLRFQSNQFRDTPNQVSLKSQGKPLGIKSKSNFSSNGSGKGLSSRPQRSTSKILDKHYSHSEPENESSLQNDAVSSNLEQIPPLFRSQAADNFPSRDTSFKIGDFPIPNSDKGMKTKINDMKAKGTSFEYLQRSGFEGVSSSRKNSASLSAAEGSKLEKVIEGHPEASLSKPTSKNSDLSDGSSSTGPKKISNSESISPIQTKNVKPLKNAAASNVTPKVLLMLAFLL
ncbi:hypothetical protein JCM33374_g5962 [Metschnikowia sp. JCM 33374]|nr:hypothetical protein JCM33374_g5962 [Metschnikowia sp. JCM 33374]